MKKLFGIFALKNGIPHLLLRREAPGVWRLLESTEVDAQSKWTHDAEYADFERPLFWRVTDASENFALSDSKWHRWDGAFDLQLQESAATYSLLRKIPRLNGRQWLCSVIGCKEASSKFTPEVSAAAFEAGRVAASLGFAVLTGGLSGVMTQAAAGAKSVGGFTLGILPGERHEDANPYIQLALPSGIGYARNYLMAAASDFMIALPGGTGTLEEMCFATDFQRPILSWGSWTVVEDAIQLPFADANALKRALIENINKKFQQECKGGPL